MQQPWFLALQAVPVLAWLSAVVWRRRTEMLANNPRLRRRRQVAQIIRQGLLELRQLASDNKSDDFFATLFRLLQEQLGERLDLPASAITEAVIEEHLRPRGVPEATLASLRELFQTCNLARYAPVKTSQELAAMIPKLEAILRELQGLEAMRPIHDAWNPAEQSEPARVGGGGVHAGAAGAPANAVLAARLRSRSLAFPVQSPAAVSAAAFDSANKLYEEGKFADAASAYEKLAQSGRDFRRPLLQSRQCVLQVRPDRPRHRRLPDG